MVAFVVMVAAVTLRFAISKPDDRIHYEVVTELTGVDFGEWPDVFYTGGGGDGEVFAVLAADPLGRGPSQEIPSVIYRYSRIGFSGAGAIASLGQDKFVLPALFFVGLLAVGVVGFFTGFLRESLGVRSWLLALNPALYIGFAGDTAEPLGLLFLIWILVSTSLVAAVLLGVTRPTYASAVLGRWKQLGAVAVVAVAVRVSAVAIFSGSIFDSAAEAFGLPFVAYFQEPSLVGFLVLLAGGATLVWGIINRDLAWIGSAGLVLVLGTGVTKDPMNLLRVVAVLPVLWAFGDGWRHELDSPIGPTS